MSGANEETYAPVDLEVTGVEAVRAEDDGLLALLLHLLAEDLRVRRELPGQEDDVDVVADLGDERREVGHLLVDRVRVSP